MGLVSIKLDVDNLTPQVKDRKRNKIHPRTLNAHLEVAGDNIYRVLDLTSKTAENPHVITSFDNYDDDKVILAVQKYMRSKNYTHYKISYLSVKGMQFIN